LSKSSGAQKTTPDDLHVYVYRDADKQLRAWQVDLCGDLARLPSTSNAMRWMGDHGLIKSQEHQDKFEVMSALYLAKTNMHVTPRFFNLPVFVIIACGKRATNHVWDSHNVIKGAADWMQSIKLYANDKDAEVWAFKKEDYPVSFPTSQLRASWQLEKTW
jgi:hypothetical protein